MGYAKVIHKKEKKRERKKVLKMNKCPRGLKQWVPSCLLEKKKMSKIAHIFL
jgi:transcription elongation factor Elf1